jgi:hypothetical protein
MHTGYRDEGHTNSTATRIYDRKRLALVLGLVTVYSRLVVGGPGGRPTHGAMVDKGGERGPPW